MEFFLADEMKSMRFALTALLEQDPTWKVVGQVSSGDDLFDLIEIFQPDFLLIDWNLPACNCENLIPTIKRLKPKLRIIAMSARSELIMKAKSAGADAFISKTEPPEKLLGAISSLINR